MPVINKLKCSFCLKTIRSNISPKLCSECNLAYHKKCAKQLNRLNEFRMSDDTEWMCTTCKQNQLYFFPFSNVSDDEFAEEFCLLRATNTGKTLDAKQLNDMFNATSDDEDDFVNLSNNDMKDPYLETSQTNFLSFNGSFKNTFSMMCVNIRSLVNSLNYSKLESLLASLNIKPDIIAITETWIQPAAKYCPYNNLPGYSFVSNCRTSFRGGGVGFYVKNNIPFTICNDMTIMQNPLCVALSIDHQPMILNQMSYFFRNLKNVEIKLIPNKHIS